MTKELELWKGEFGDKYRERNQILPELLNSRMMLWSCILQNITALGTRKEFPESILEVGAGGGINLVAIDRIYKARNELAQFFACEPNVITQKQANNFCRDEGFLPTWLPDANALDLKLNTYSVDMVYTSGVLIHINPDDQLKALEEIYRVSKRFIICIEYFSAELREVNYHEHKALWTRDYGSLWMDNFPALRCLGCTFAWKRSTKLDNLTTWMFEKVN